MPKIVTSSSSAPRLIVLLAALGLGGPHVAGASGGPSASAMGVMRCAMTRGSGLVQDTSDSTPLPLTDTVVVRYLRVRTAVFTAVPADPQVAQTAQATERAWTVAILGPDGTKTGKTMSGSLPDFPKLAAEYPTIAQLFAQSHVAPEQFVPVTKAIGLALGTIAAQRATGSTLTDSSHVRTQNIAVVLRHQEALATAGMAVTAVTDGQGKPGDAALGHAVAVGQPAPPLVVTKWLQPASDWQPTFGDGHVYVLDFTAEWCGPCQAVYPALHDVQKKYAALGMRTVSATALWGAFGGVNVSADAELDSLKQYFPAHQVTNPVAIFDAPIDVMKSGYFEGNAINLPRIVVIDGKGIVRTILGAGQEQEIDAVVAEAGGYR